jgi:hypothetical protein
MMSRLVMTDLTVGETLAFLTGLYVQGDLSTDEYLQQVRHACPGEESTERIIERWTDWDLLNRMLGHPDSTCPA